MSVARRDVLASALGAGVGSRVKPCLGSQSSEPRVFSGSDLGFRVQGTTGDGAPIGELVVRVDGKWVAAQFQPVLRRAT